MGAQWRCGGGGHVGQKERSGFDGNKAALGCWSQANGLVAVTGPRKTTTDQGMGGGGGVKLVIIGDISF